MKWEKRYQTTPRREGQLLMWFEAPPPNLAHCQKNKQFLSGGPGWRGGKGHTHLVSACLASSSCLPGIQKHRRKTLSQEEGPTSDPRFRVCGWSPAAAYCRRRGSDKGLEGEGCAHSPPRHTPHSSVPIVAFPPGSASDCHESLTSKLCRFLSSRCLSQGLAHSRWYVKDFRMNECDFSCPACFNCGW